MSIRQTLNQNKKASAAAATAFVLIAAAILAYNFWPRRAPIWDKQFYSDDDGKTYFVDDKNRIPPYDHNGKTAVLASVFKTKSGNLFVGFLKEFSADNKKQVEAQITEAIKNGQPPESVPLLSGMSAPFLYEVKRPGDTKWVPMASAEGNQIQTQLKTPDGSEIDIAVMPPSD